IWYICIPTMVTDLDPHVYTTTGQGIKHDQPVLDIGTMLRKPKQYNITDHVVPAGWVETNQNEEHRAGTLHVARGSAKTSMFEKVSTRRRELNRLATRLGPLDTTTLQ